MSAKCERCGDDFKKGWRFRNSNDLMTDSHVCPRCFEDWCKAVETGIIKIGHKTISDLSMKNNEFWEIFLTTKPKPQREKVTFD